MRRPRGGRGLAPRAWTGLLIAASLVAVVCGCQPLSYRPPPRGTPPPPLKVLNANLVNAQNNQPVQIKALNWFGFNNGQGSVDGLWTGGSDLATDFLELVYQTKLLGFNAVRLPFRFTDLQNTAPDRTRGCRPSPAWQTKRHVTDPVYHPSSKPLPPPAIVVPRPQGDRKCNSYMPQGTGLDRLLWTIQVFNAHGMYVILDYHGSNGQSLEKEAIATARIFASKWAGFWRAVNCLPNFAQDFAGRVIPDILNEPDMLGLKWGPVQSLDHRDPNWTTLALAAMDTLYTINPQAALFMISGTGQTKYGVNWGNGYITDPGIISREGLSDPNPFFMELLRRPYVRRVILGPHCYPPSVTMATYLGADLHEKLTTSFGYLQTRGYCPKPASVYASYIDFSEEVEEDVPVTVTTPVNVTTVNGVPVNAPGIVGGGAGDGVPPAAGGSAGVAGSGSGGLSIASTTTAVPVGLVAIAASRPPVSTAAATGTVSVASIADPKPAAAPAGEAPSGTPAGGATADSAPPAPVLPAGRIIANRVLPNGDRIILTRVATATGGSRIVATRIPAARGAPARVAAAGVGAAATAGRVAAASIDASDRPTGVAAASVAAAAAAIAALPAAANKAPAAAVPSPAATAPGTAIAPNAVTGAVAAVPVANTTAANATVVNVTTVMVTKTVYVKRTVTRRMSAAEFTSKWNAGIEAMSGVPLKRTASRTASTRTATTRAATPPRTAQTALASGAGAASRRGNDFKWTSIDLPDSNNTTPNPDNSTSPTNNGTPGGPVPDGTGINNDTTTNATTNGTTGANDSAVAEDPTSGWDVSIYSPRVTECVKFPVIIGEFGSLFEQPTDIQWLNDFASWLDGQGRAVGAPVGWAYWAYNANSGDTGGIVGANWQTFMWAKIRFLQQRMGLKPWYA